jgi:type I restriction enzyme S subunit
MVCLFEDGFVDFGSTEQTKITTMEVKAGYKQTEVGVIPEDWDIKPLGEVLKVKHGKSQKEVEDRGGKYPILGTGGLMGYTNHFLYDKPSVLIGRKGTIDKPRFMYTPFWTVDTLFYTEIFKNFSPKYLYFKFLQVDWYSYNEASGVPSLNAKTIEKIELVFPSTFEEQTAIATTLSDIDALISSLEKLIAKKRNIKQGAMQKLLKPKDGWEVKKLGEVLKIKHGKSQKEVEDKNGKYPILGTGGLMSYTNQFLSNKPSVLIGRKGTIDKPQFMNSPFWTVDTLFYTEIFEGYDAKFIFYIFNLIDWYSYNEASGVPSLNAKTIEKIEKSFPHYGEQIRISTILTDMDAEITALEIKLDKYKNMKLGMMQTLLTGKIRLV